MWTKDAIKELLLDPSDKGMHAVGRALVALLNRQTADEKHSQETKYLNGMGFAPCDAFVGTAMATFYKDRGYLTEKQVAYWRRGTTKRGPRIVKYAGQLLIVAKEKREKNITQSTLQEG